MIFKNFLEKIFGKCCFFLNPSLLFLNESYSQEGEDLTLERIFSNIKSGFYVNIGAHHPFKFSNTYKLYKKGWKGVNIDANPGSKKLFDKYLSRDVNIECVILNEEKDIEFFIYNESALNSIYDRREELKNTPYKLDKIITIKSRNINNILKDNNVKEFDFLNIDIEGLDSLVLKSLNLEKHRPNCICIEVQRNRNVDNDDIDLFLKNNNYELLSIFYNSRIYINKV